MKIGILGAGGWGTALAILLYNKGYKTVLWEYDAAQAENLRKTRKNEKFLPGVKLPDGLAVTNHIDEAIIEKDFVVFVTPSHTVRSVCEKIKKTGIKKIRFVNAVKGIENNTLLRMSQVVLDVLPFVGESSIGVLSGPSHAEEVSREVPTAVVVASYSKDFAKFIQDAFFTNRFRVYQSDDVIGLELGGALKNVIAIASGISDGAGLGDNTKAALFTRGLAEIKRLGKKMGADDLTFSGLAGIGDLVVTCNSKLSRNRFVGEQIGKGLKLRDILESMNMVAEGVKTTLSAYNLAQKLKVETPIIEQVYEILYNDKDPMEGLNDLMSRTPKHEHWE
ncbi:NAD(P)H-dependent glycerol-3-phosphate dehydrogenase [candidate division KSB1 bacterium]